MKPIELHENMGPAIMSRLQDYVELPKSGFLAGQAVASAVSELFGDGRAVVYNDVDVFREQTEYDLQSLREMREENDSNWGRRTLSTCTFNTHELDVTYGGLDITKKSHYEVKHAARKDMLNEIQCHGLSWDIAGFLKTFDINAVQVGIDLKVQKLVWTPAFNQFCQSRQLEIVAMHTPFHSLIRYFRKLEELEGTYGNNERMIELVAAAYHLQRIELEQLGVKKPVQDLQWRFGKVYADKLDKVKTAISPYFDITTEEINGYPITSMVPNFQIEKDMQNLDTKLVDFLPVISRALREKHGKGMQERLNYLLKHKPEKRSHLTLSFHCQGESFVKGNVTPAQMAQMDSVLHEHGISHYLHPLTTLGEQFARFKLIEKEVQARGKWVYGVLETQRAFNIENELKDVLDERERLLKEKLTEPVFSPRMLHDYSVRELITGQELLIEGESVHHCVGGYALSVKNGTAIIVSIRKGTHVSGWTTLELNRKGKGWVVQQHRGLQNRSVTEDEKSIAATYCSHVNVATIFGAKVAEWGDLKYPQQTQVVGEFIERILTKQQPNQSLWFKSQLGRLSHKMHCFLKSPSSFFTKRGFVYPKYAIFSYWAAYLKHSILGFK